MISKLSTISLLVGSSLSAVLYDHAKSDVSIYTPINFEKQVTKNRESGVSIVHFYKSTGKFNNWVYFTNIFLVQMKNQKTWSPITIILLPRTKVFSESDQSIVGTSRPFAKKNQLRISQLSRFTHRSLFQPST